MKKSILFNGLTFLLLSVLFACEDSEFTDIVPKSFLKIELNPDEIYMYNTEEGTPIGVRLDPLVNDSIKIDVTVTYGTPAAGTISFIENEGWFYKPQAGFYGTDQFNYTACHENNCATSTIKMHVEKVLDLTNCTFEINGESAETTAGQPISIRIFDNDIVCPYMGNSISAPEKGTFSIYTYSGNYKNTVYVYYPPKGYIGTDRFKYRLFTPTGYLETYCTITIKP
jgi:hypothetical protein